MGKQADKIKNLVAAFPQLSEMEAKQFLEVHGSVEDATSALLDEGSKWSKVKTAAPKVDKKDKVNKHKTPAGVAAASPRDASPRGDRPPREPRAPRADAGPVKKVAPKVEATMKIEINSGKVAQGMSFLDMLKKKSEPEAPVVVEAPAAPATDKKGGDKKKKDAPVEEEEVAHNPSQDPPAPIQSQAAAAASPEAAVTSTEEPAAKKERVKKPKAPKPAKVEQLYYVPTVETSETLSFPDHVIAHQIDESVKFISNPGEAPAPPQQQHIPPQHMGGMPHHQQPRGGYGYSHPNAGYGNRVGGAPRQHVNTWQGNQEAGQTWQHAPMRQNQSNYQPRPAAGHYPSRNDFNNRGAPHGQQVEAPNAYNMRPNHTWGS